MCFRISLVLLLSVLAGPVFGQGAAGACPAKLEIEQVLNQLNTYRAQAQVCGQQPFVAAEPLRWEARLEQAAQGHANELAQGDQLKHLGSSGRNLRERLRATGYLAFRVGENLAAGQESWDEALQTWIVSAKHCENIMQDDFRDVALACASGPGKYGRYWVLNLGRSVQD